MENIMYMYKLPLPKEYNILRKNVGWGEMPINVIKNSFKKTLYGVSVYNNNEIIGSWRIVCDNGLCFYIQDIMVIKAFQKKGIGTKIVELLIAYIEKNGVYNSYVGLFSAKGLEKFYSKFGFIERPNEYFGSGMTQFWGRKGGMEES
jgi:GNAT superfamily N-acetyltransferase